MAPLSDGKGWRLVRPIGKAEYNVAKNTAKTAAETEDVVVNGEQGGDEAVQAAVGVAKQP